ncbi:MAG: 7-carboxy-7-deazaguanine synthase QueE [Candidatus Sericytochromatia bacterium]
MLQSVLESPIQKPETSNKAFLVEIFSAIQGEGPIVGTRQIFVRFLGCHIQCAYCDTPATHTKQRQCRVERTPGIRDFEAIQNPLPISQVVEILDRLEVFPGLHDGVSLTGGEPLQHIRSLLALIPLLKDRFPLYLETDGILYENLAHCVDDIEQIGMDIKIPSATMLQPYWEEHRKFLKIAMRTNVFVKAVVSASTTREELNETLAIIRECDASIPLILQPVTPYGVIRKPPTPEQILEWQTLAKRALKNVRVIPQTHKMMGQI